MFRYIAAKAFQSKEIILFLVMLIGILPSANAVTLLYKDGRINQGQHLGFGVVYCFDRNGNTTNVASPDGGIKVINSGGPAPGLALLITQAEISAVGVPTTGPAVITSQGGYTLWRLPDGKFRLTGLDEYGKAFSFDWSNCTPVVADSPARAPIVSGDDTSSGTDGGGGNTIDDGDDEDDDDDDDDFPEECEEFECCFGCCFGPEDPWCF